MHYLGPTVGKLPLKTWEQVEMAAKGGQLEETQWVELKKQLGPSKKAVNTELARDLASLSVFGGVLIFGVEDGTFDVVGCDISGMVDRISQVASMSIMPPLSPVIYAPVVNPHDATKHVLIVEVPRSPQAPHMADEHHWGRSSNGKRKLSDPEIRSLMQARVSTDDQFRAQLLAMVDEDPLEQFIEGHPTGNGHIYLLAEPSAPVVRGGVNLKLIDVAINVGGTRYAAGTIPSCTYRASDPLGLAVSSQVSGDVLGSTREEAAAYLVCHDDFTLSFVSGGGTCHRRGQASDGSEEWVNHWAIIESTVQFFHLLRTLSLDHCGYTGQWRVGLHVTNLKGKLVRSNDRFIRARTFPRSSYIKHIVTSPATWGDDRPEVAARALLAGFLRAIDRENMDLEQMAI